MKYGVHCRVWSLHYNETVEIHDLILRHYGVGIKLHLLYNYKVCLDVLRNWVTMNKCLPTLF